MAQGAGRKGRRVYEGAGRMDRNSDPKNALLEYWLGSSFNGGVTFLVNIQMSNATFNGDWIGPGVCDMIGDRPIIMANNETIAAVWCDCRNGGGPRHFREYKYQ